MIKPPPSDIRKQVAEMAPWFHNLHLPDGTQTAPDHFLGDFPSFKWKEFSGYLPERLDRWEVLDVGCNAGFYSSELAKRRARVTGIDLNGHYLSQAKWAAARYGLEDASRFPKIFLPGFTCRRMPGNLSKHFYENTALTIVGSPASRPWPHPT